MKDNNSCFVNLTYRCNNNCISCILKTKQRRSKDPTSKKILKKIDHILSWSNHIEFNGGEPSLRKDFFEILDYVCSRKPEAEIGILSNCRAFFNSGFVKRLSDCGPKKIKVVTTLYGHTPKLHDAITRAPGSFSQQIAGIKNLISLGINVELRVVLNNLNYTYLPQIARYICSNFDLKEMRAVSFINLKISGAAVENKDIVAYSVQKTLPHLDAACNLLLKNNYGVKLFNFPHCVLPEKLRNFSAGQSAERNQVKFLMRCKRCSLREDCSGIWRGYLKIFGKREFSPQ